MNERLRSFIVDQSLLVKIFGFFIFMVLMTTIIGVTNGINLIRINHQLQNISQVYTPGLTEAATLKSIVAREEAEALEVVMIQRTPEERWEHINNFRNLNRSFNSHIKRLEKIGTSPATRFKLHRIEQKHQDFAYIANTMFTRGIKNKTTVVNQIFPNYKAVALEMQASSDEFYNYYSDQVEATEANIFNQSKHSQLISLALVSFGILTGLTLMPLLGLVVKQPIKNLINVTDTLATGELRIRADAERKDELGALAISINQMAESMGSLLSDITNTVGGLVSAGEKLSVASSKSSGVANELKEDIGVLESQARLYTEKVNDLSQELLVITNEVENVFRRSGDVQHFVENLATAARRGGDNSEIAMEQMSITETKVKEMGIAIASFRNYAKEIVKITRVISGFAKSTNMLALNASIEAAKAGESGRGFAVVAEEIRKLANDSSQSVNEIAQLIGKIQAEAEISVGTVSDGIEAITENRKLVDVMAKDLANMVHDVTEILGKMKDVTGSMGKIQNSTTSFTHWIDDITTYADLTITNTVKAKEKINEQLNVAGTVSSQANALNQLGEDLSLQIHKFKR